VFTPVTVASLYFNCYMAGLRCNLYCIYLHQKAKHAGNEVHSGRAHA